jgi:hypothetical protein
MPFPYALARKRRRHRRTLIESWALIALASWIGGLSQAKAQIDLHHHINGHVWAILT